MGNQTKTKTAFLITIVSLIFICSCAQTSPDIKYTTGTVIFDFKDTESTPEARFSVFVESESDVRRYTNIKLTSLSKKYVWEADELDEIVNFTTPEKKYAGYTNFVMPENEKIPKGEYEVVYSNADQSEITTKLYVDYDNNFYSIKAGEVPALMTRKAGKKNILIYDKDNKIIYFGERTNEISDSRKIWNKYRDASYFYEVWISSQKTVMCVMPRQEVIPGN